MLIALLLEMRSVFVENSFNNIHPEYKKVDDAVDSFVLHDLVIAVKQRNMNQIESILNEVSDPFSKNYGAYLSSTEVAKICANPIGSKKIHDFLKSNDIEVVGKTLFGDYITVRGFIHQWESIFLTKFHIFENIYTNQRVLRAISYSLPASISDHISTIFYFIHLPPPSSHIHPVSSQNTASSSGITPSVLRNYYNIFYSTGTQQLPGSQTVYSASGQYFSAADLANFQKSYGIPPHPVDSDTNDRNSASACYANSDNCAESNLDLQYITGLAQYTWTSIMYDPVLACIRYLQSIASFSFIY